MQQQALRPNFRLLHQRALRFPSLQLPCAAQAYPLSCAVWQRRLCRGWKPGDLLFLLVQAGVVPLAQLAEQAHDRLEVEVLRQTSARWRIAQMGLSYEEVQRLGRKLQVGL